MRRVQLRLIEVDSSDVLDNILWSGFLDNPFSVKLSYIGFIQKMIHLRSNDI